MSRSAGWRHGAVPRNTTIGGQMARPLDKIVKGERLKRPPEIEAAIDTALGQDIETIRRRAAIIDETSADYLPTECLVHLIRHTPDSRIKSQHTTRGRTRSSIA